MTEIEQNDGRLEREDNLANLVEFRKARAGGRKPGGKNLSPMMRNIIGAAAKIDGNNAEVARTFNVDERSVASYKLGRTSHAQPIVPQNKAEVERHVDRLTEKRTKIIDGVYDRIASLFDDDGPVSPETIKTLKPREATAVAKDLASVVEKVTPRDRVADGRVNVVVFAPRVRDEDEYEVIEVDARVVD